MGEPLYLKLQENVTPFNRTKENWEFSKFQEFVLYFLVFSSSSSSATQKRKKRSDNKNDYATFFTKKQTIPARSGSFFQRLVEWSVCLSPAAAALAPTVFRIFEMICLKCTLTKFICNKSLFWSRQRQHAYRGSFRSLPTSKRCECFVVAAKSSKVLANWVNL